MIPALISPPTLNELWGYIKTIAHWIKTTRYRRIMQIQSKAWNNPNLFDYLACLYNGHNILQHKGVKFPAVVFPAPKNQRYDIESPLSKLNKDLDDSIDNKMDQVGQGYLTKLREAPESPWEGPTYRMIKFESQGQLKLTCGVGGYYNALKSCDVLKFELLREFGKKPPTPEEFLNFTDNLVLRRHIHSKGNPFEKPLGRSAAIGISTLIVFVENHKYKALLRERSQKVAIYPNLIHVIPSFMFEPAVWWYEEEYSVRHNIYREYLEEVLGRKDVERPKGEYGFDFFYEDPNLKYLQHLEKKDKAKFYFTGIDIDLLNLRPEICTLLLIKDPSWIINQRRGKKVGHYQLKPMRINWEFKMGDDTKGTTLEGKGSVDLTENLVIPDNFFKPENFTPAGAAALKLGIEVAREELGLS